MKKETIIKPSKPIIVKGILGCMIKLNKNQIDYGNLESKKELKGFREQTKRHITIVGDKTLTKIENVLNKFPVSERKNKIAKLKSILKNLEWKFLQKRYLSYKQEKIFGRSKNFRT